MRLQMSKVASQAGRWFHNDRSGGSLMRARHKSETVEKNKYNPGAGQQVKRGADAYVGGQARTKITP
jgi:hypothetical protein